MNKILKAIQEGIKQSFMIDSESADEEFVKSKVVSNNINVDALQKHFDDLCKSCDTMLG